MTTVPYIAQPAAIPAQQGRIRAWLTAHKVSLITLVPLLLVVGIVSGWNFTGYPGTVNDDEGTYVDQAWAILFRGDLAHYTYWYDHPPFGWMQIAGYAWLTDGFHRADYAVMMGRELMLITNVVSSALVYLIMRRMQFHRVWAVIAVLLFAVSPLAIYYHRMVFLDNLQTMWVLAAMACAVSPRRSINSAIAAGLCLTASTMSKETGGVLLPVVFLLIWQYRDKGDSWRRDTEGRRVWRLSALRHSWRHRNRGDRSWSLSMFCASYFGSCFVYPLYAILKNELFEGKGHVSLVYALKWQTFGRESTGSPLDTNSETFHLMEFWFNQDVWLVFAALALLPIGFIIRRTRAFALGYFLQVALLFKGSYIPKAYAITLIPFAALLIAGVVAVLCRTLFAKRQTRSRRKKGAWHWLTIGVSATVLASLVGSFGIIAAPQWQRNITVAAERDSVKHYRETLAWLEKHTSKDSVMVVDDNLWPDLEKRGYFNKDWIYKIDLDPAVKKNYPKGWKDVDYVIIDRLPLELLEGLPTVYKAMQHSSKVFESGNRDVGYTVYKVDPNSKAKRLK